MDMLQMALMVEYDFKQVYPSINEDDNYTYVQYDFNNKHLRFEIENDDFTDPNIYGCIRNRAYYWMKGLTK